MAEELPPFTEIYHKHPGASRALGEAFAAWQLAMVQAKNPNYKGSLADHFTGSLTVEFRINGEEIPFIPMMDAAFEIHQGLIREHAARLFQSKLEEFFPDELQKLSEKIHEVVGSVNFEIRSLTRKAFPDIYLDEDD